MIVTVDVGNTRIKAAVFEGDTSFGFFVFEKVALGENLKKILDDFPLVESVVVSSVGDIDKASFLVFESRVKVCFISRENVFPFENNYGTPSTLGIDRMVLAAGATLMFPNQNRLVIDAGTCVTYDFVDENNVYQGGAIAPGMRLRYESMHNFTAKLPLLQLESPESYIGKSTAQSMHSGVVNGLVYEIDGFIDTYRASCTKIIIILTGGDAEFLAKRLKNTIFANSNFLLESLNQTYQYQINND